MFPLAPAQTGIQSQEYRVPRFRGDERKEDGKVLP